MIRISYVLSGEEGKTLYRSDVMLPGNDLYLILEGDSIDVEYPQLYELTDYDIEIYLPEHMKQLIKDLIKLKATLTDASEISHVDEIIGLCCQCQQNNKGQIMFDPFIGTYEFSDEAKAKVAKEIKAMSSDAS